MRKLITILMIVSFMALMAGCSSERYGAPVDKKAQISKVKDIYLDPNPIGKPVTLKGRVSSQCGSNGCWFVLSDETGQIFINLAPNNMTIPPRMNKNAMVTGVVTVNQGELQLVANGVEIQ